VNYGAVDTSFISVVDDTIGWASSCIIAYQVYCSIFRGKNGVMKKDNSLINYSWLGVSSHAPTIEVLMRIKDYTNEVNTLVSFQTWLYQLDESRKQ